MSLNKDNSYSISSKNFKKILNYNGSDLSLTPDSNYSNFPVKVSYNRDESLSFTYNNNTLSVYLICSPDLCYAFFSTSTIPNQITFSNFKLNLDGSILAHDSNNTVKLFIDTDGSLRISPDINSVDYSFRISTFTVPLAMASNTDISNNRILQTIWNENLVLGAIEKDLVWDNDKTNKDYQIPRGFFCRLGNYTSADGTARNCNYHDYRDNGSNDGQGGCIGDNGLTENLATINNKRCRHIFSLSDCDYPDNFVNCDSDEINFHNDTEPVTGGCFFQKRHSSCTKNWNTSTKDYCAEGVGNPNALPRDVNGNIISTDKLSFRNCMLWYNNQQPSYDDFNGEFIAADNKDKAGFPINSTPASWSPWSHETLDSDIYVNFCAEPDTINGIPRFQVPSSNCFHFVQDSDKAKKVKDRYCSQYPDTDFCADFCVPPPDVNGKLCTQGPGTPDCYSTMANNFCTGQNLDTDICRKWLKNDNVCVDGNIISYCSDLSGGMKEALNHPVCGCFLPDTNYYNNFYKSLRKYITLPEVPDAQPAIPWCSFPNCRLSGIKPIDLKQSPNLQCPDIYECIQIANLPIDGDITSSSDINVYMNNICDISYIPQPGPNCAPIGNSCKDISCCSPYSCVNDFCVSLPPCKDVGSDCNNVSECCIGLDCYNGKCSSPTPVPSCVLENKPCDKKNVCCTGLNCSNGICISSIPSCKSKDSSCDDISKLCCTGLACINNICESCSQIGQRCAINNDCCYPLICGPNGGCVPACKNEGEDCSIDLDCCDGNFCGSDKKCQKKPTIWSKYKWYILGGIFLIFLIILGVVLFRHKNN